MNVKEQLEKEIDELRYELSVTIPQEIQTAIEMGDLRENSEYAAAMERQYFVLLRLDQLMQRLQAHQQINLAHIPKDKVGIGSMVKARCLRTKKIVYFKLTSESTDTDQEFEEITINSPIGKALMNREKNEIVEVQCPIGKQSYKILQLQTIHDLT